MNIFFVGCNTRCIPFSVIFFLSQSGMNADGYCRGYVSFAHFCYIYKCFPKAIISCNLVKQMETYLFHYVML